MKKDSELRACCFVLATMNEGKCQQKQMEARNVSDCWGHGYRLMRVKTDAMTLSKQRLW